MNIRELLSSLNVPFKENGESPHVTEGWVGIICPFCGIGTSKHGLGIHLRSARVSCWKCGSHRLGDTLALVSNRPLREIMPLIGDMGASLPAPERPAGKYKAPDGVGPMMGAHRRYLEGRGFDPDQLAEQWGIQGIGMDGPAHLRWRLFLPVRWHGEDVSWTTRAIGAVLPRYYSAPPEMEGMPLKSLLFGMDRVRHSVIVTEGPFDAIRIGPGAVATCGLTVTRAQMLALSRVPQRTILFDSEREAQRRAVKLADALAPYPGVTYIAVTSGHDPATAPESEICELRSRFLV